MATDYAWGYEVRFSEEVLPELAGLGVEALGVRRHGTDSELHVSLVLPSHDRVLREKVLGMLDSFEESNAFLVTISPALLYAEDLADA